MSTESLKIILDSIKGKIDFQLNADNGIDSKSGILIGLIGVVAVFYLNIKNGYIGYIPFIGLAIASFFLFKLTDPKRYNTGSLDPGELLSFISSKGSDKGWFFTLNQDLFMERKHNYRSPGAMLSQPFIEGDNGKIGTITLPNEDGIEKAKNTLNNASYIKLHGSYGWISSHGGNQMVIGKNKVNDIDQEPLLKWYFEIFQNLIKEGNKKLLIIGYGFADNHINDILLNGIQEHGLSLYIISTTDPEMFKNRLEGKPSHSGSWEVSKYSKIWNGVKGYFPYSLREIYPPDQSVTTISLEIKKALGN